MLPVVAAQARFEAGRFPAADDAGLFTVKRMHFALVTFEDAPAAVIQIFYVALHSDDTSAATWLSLVATCVAAMWRLFVKADDACRGRTDATPETSNESERENDRLRAQVQALEDAAAAAALEKRNAVSESPVQVSELESGNDALARSEAACGSRGFAREFGENRGGLPASRLEDRFASLGLGLAAER